MALLEFFVILAYKLGNCKILLVRVIQELLGKVVPSGRKQISKKLFKEFRRKRKIACIYKHDTIL